MTVDEYLAHQPEEEKTDSKLVSGILDSEVEVWVRVHWRLSEENFVEIKECGEEIKNQVLTYRILKKG